MCIDLVFSYSIDATNRLFTESDALRRGFFPPEPGNEGGRNRRKDLRADAGDRRPGRTSDPSIFIAAT